jgi:stress response protein YsnF
VERLPVNRPLEAPAAQRMEGEWLVLPVMAEVLVVRTQLVLTEEVRVRTRRVTEEQEVRAPVRRERLELEDATRDGVRGLPAAAGPGPAPDPH